MEMTVYKEQSAAYLCHFVKVELYVHLFSLTKGWPKHAKIS